ncbi:MAG: type II/IV secretion system protein [Candidatus Liptonbacteria bacterium]|nr:type II/IV secretion system protein [Candidatus Liptonbacteria bacterium]
MAIFGPKKDESKIENPPKKKEVVDVASLKLDIEKQITKPIDEVSIVSLVNLFVKYAYVARASDVHLDPTPDKIRVRFRIDGMLHDIFDKIFITKSLHQEIISRIKVMSGLRTDEHFLPQDGRFKTDPDGVGAIDVRVSIMPTYYGENAVLRLLAETQTFTLEDLGFAPEELKKVERAIKKPYGMILANGPTGSGKSTTLYTILKKLNVPETSIITVEDPIEYSLEGITQVQADARVGLTFANGLRSILRQDPNVIMVGEIRDQETAGIAVNAALTGHLLLSTLHTNDAATTFPRLMDMGVPPFLIASTINIVMGQRLVRMICPDCKKKRDLSASELQSVREMIPGLKDKQPVFYIGEGCATCGKIGYKGRIGIREVIEVNDEIRELIMARANNQTIKDAAIKNGMKTMLQNGLALALEGKTSLEEVLRIIHE